MKRILESIVEQSFHLSVWLIERFHNLEAYEQQLKNLQKLPIGTLGRAVADCLKEHNLRLVPGYKSHDLKHSLLDYDMTPVDEIRLQSFMIGNGNITIPSIAIFTFGFLLLPHKWLQLANDFHRGLNSKAIKKWTLEEYASKNLNELREEVIMTDKKELNVQALTKRISFLGSITAMVLGGFGMIYCLPFLFSSQLEDLIGAGFPFVAGAILFVGGLLCLSILNRKVNLNYNIPE